MAQSLLTKELMAGRTRTPSSPWALVMDVIQNYTCDSYLAKSLFYMVTMRYRFDHIHYVSTIRSMHATENRLIKHENCAKALVFLSKIQFAMPSFPKVYETLWSQLGPLLKEWETYIYKSYDDHFAFQVVHDLDIPPKSLYR